jgi:CheY-like chemotaxis protein
MSKPSTRAVRAAALVILAIGASGVIAQLAPRYGALCVYAAALISIAWLEGIVFGAVGAAAAAVGYALLFARGALDPGELAVALATSLLLPLLALWRRAKPAPAPLMIPKDSEADALRVQLADALAKLYEANQQTEQLCEQYESEGELMQRENEELRAQIAALQQAPNKSNAQRRPLILVVHGDPAIRSMSRQSIERQGFETIGAADGLEGLRLAVAHKPAVVVTDGTIPKMDGRELCQLIKSNPETSGVRVLLMSSDARDEVARELGPDELLPKPLQVDALQTALARLMGSESGSES